MKKLMMAPAAMFFLGTVIFLSGKPSGESALMPDSGRPAASVVNPEFMPFLATERDEESRSIENDRAAIVRSEPNVTDLSRRFPAAAARLFPASSAAPEGFDLSCPAFYSEGIVFRNGSAAVRQSLMGGSAAIPATESGAVHYREVWPGVDAVIVRKGTGAEELLRISPGAATQLTYEFRIDSPEGAFRAGERFEAVDGTGVSRMQLDEIVYWCAGEEGEKRPETNLELVDARTARLSIFIPGQDAAREILLDPSWTVTGSLQVARNPIGSCSVRLSDGRVLVAGGAVNASYYYSTTSTCELYNPATGAWSSTGSLTNSRSEHTITLLPSGKVLVTGGRSVKLTKNGNTWQDLATCELYNPATGTWISARRMGTVRYGHGATLLGNGTVLVAGGASSLSAEIYNPATNLWSSTTAPPLPPQVANGILLSNGNALLLTETGGQVYNPTTKTWNVTGTTGLLFSYPRAVLLSDGRVLATGFYSGSSSNPISNECRIFDPGTNSWSMTGSMGVGRGYCTLTSLSNGMVLATGGMSNEIVNNSRVLHSSSELYDPASGTWSSSLPMGLARFNHGAIGLQNGVVLIFGGYATATGAMTAACELYTP